MSLLRCSLFGILTISVLLLNMHAEVVDAGPLSLSFARSFRSGREIRTPFKTNGIMVARGFGKRNAVTVIEDRNLPTAIASKSTTTSTSSAGNSGGDDFDVDKIALDSLAAEMSTNPGLARLILHRFVDFNGDGKISKRELAFSNPFESFEYY